MARKRMTCKVGDVLACNGVYFQIMEGDCNPMCLPLQVPESLATSKKLLYNKIMYKTIFDQLGRNLPTIYLDRPDINKSIKEGETQIVFNIKDLLVNLQKRVNID